MSNPMLTLALMSAMAERLEPVDTAIQALQQTAKTMFGLPVISVVLARGVYQVTLSDGPERMVQAEDENLTLAVTLAGQKAVEAKKAGKI